MGCFYEPPLATYLMKYLTTTSNFIIVTER